MNQVHAWSRCCRQSFTWSPRHGSDALGEHNRLVEETHGGKGSQHYHHSAAVHHLGDAAELKRLQRRTWCLRVATFLACWALVVYTLTRLPVNEYMLTTSAWIKAHQFSGTVVAIVIFWVAIPLFMPCSIIEAIAGSLFGVTHGLVVVVIGKTGGCFLSFLIGRYLARDMIGTYLTSHFPAFRALSDVLVVRGWKPLVLLQLSSLPNLLKCYGLAVTELTSIRFILSSLVGGAPNAIIWVNIGNQASDIAAILSGNNELSSEKAGMILAGTVLTIVAMGFLVIYTRRELQQIQKRECDSGSEDEDILIEVEGEPLAALHSEVNELCKVRLHTNSTDRSVILQMQQDR